MGIIDTATRVELEQLLAAGSAIDTQEIINTLNRALPSDRQIGRGVGVTQGVFKRFGEFDRVDAKIERVTAGLWTNDQSVIDSFYTSSEQSTLSKHYYYNVYSSNPAVDTTAEVEFAVAYGNINGSGSVDLITSPSASLASTATYSQYRSLLLNDTQSLFEFDTDPGGSVDAESRDIFVINVSRSRYREKMDAQNWQLTIGGHTFIDDSGKKFDDQEGRTGRVFNIVSGSLNIGTGNPATITQRWTSDPGGPNDGYGYGLFYPHQGIIVLNPAALMEDGIINGLNSGSNTESENHKLLVNEIEEFHARRVENISTQHFFVRATNREFNFSNNPTFAGNDGVFLVPGFTDNPKVYVTTVGLYNESNEMIAVAKSSQPIPKSFDRELLMRVKLDF